MTLSLGCGFYAARKEEAKMRRSAWRPCKLLVVFMHKSAAMSGTLHGVIERKRRETPRNGSQPQTVDEQNPASLFKGVPPLQTPHVILG